MLQSLDVISRTLTACEDQATSTDAMAVFIQKNTLVRAPRPPTSAPSPGIALPGLAMPNIIEDPDFSKFASSSLPPPVACVTSLGPNASRPAREDPFAGLAPGEYRARCALLDTAAHAQARLQSCRPCTSLL
jgi:hypothetical protein